MNDIINKFLLAGDIFIPEMYLKQPGLLIVLVDYLIKTKKESKSSKKLDIQDIFTEMNYIKPVFNMISFMEILET